MSNNRLWHYYCPYPLSCLPLRLHINKNITKSNLMFQISRLDEDIQLLKHFCCVHCWICLWLKMLHCPPLQFWLKKVNSCGIEWPEDEYCWLCWSPVFTTHTKMYGNQVHLSIIYGKIYEQMPAEWMVIPSALAKLCVSCSLANVSMLMRQTKMVIMVNVIPVIHIHISRTQVWTLWKYNIIYIIFHVVPH